MLLLYMIKVNNQSYNIYACKYINSKTILQPFR